ncbi:tRNA uracil 4-sulfurtransferase ThiI [Saccharospirillum salsuginis]|nr:tRNA uracil 4-sulfurtransferase ThiI [Saccharospirillum salsuginis]
MLYTIKLHPEITIKTKPVRQLMTKSLAQNTRNVLRRIHPDVTVRNDWDSILVRTPDATEDRINEAIEEALECIPGIAFYNAVVDFPLGDFDDMVRDTLSVWREDLAGKTFCVRVKRSGHHDFSSVDAERYVGGGLNKFTDAAGVRLKHPEVEVKLEIKRNRVYVVKQRRRGMGGYPLGTQETVLSLVSGGFDSTVAAYQMLRRGVKSHFLFFNLGGAAHENGVKEVIYYLWKKFGSSHKVNFVSVPFEGVVEEILSKVEDRYMGVVLKRMMMRAAEQVATYQRIPALVTGEAIAQVSSQTLPNLSHIDDVTDSLVIRPLIVTDKPEIIDIARNIGTATFAERMPEYCGVISRKPNAACKRVDVEAAETDFDWAVLEQAVEAAKTEAIDEMTWVSQDDLEADLDAPADSDRPVTVIDVRHPTEAEVSPLELAGQEVLQIPFYSLNRRFGGLDPDVHYLLYCDKGVMSKLHALHLKDAGFDNVGVYHRD